MSVAMFVLQAETLLGYLREQRQQDAGAAAAAATGLLR